MLHPRKQLHRTIYSKQQSAFGGQRWVKYAPVGGLASRQCPNLSEYCYTNLPTFQPSTFKPLRIFKLKAKTERIIERRLETCRKLW